MVRGEWIGVGRSAEVFAEGARAVLHGLAGAFAAGEAPTDAEWAEARARRAGNPTMTAGEVAQLDQAVATARAATAVTGGRGPRDGVCPG